LGKFDWQKKQVEAFPVYGLKNFVKKDFRFVQTQDNKLFISGGMGSFEMLHEAFEDKNKQIILTMH